MLEVQSPTTLESPSPCQQGSDASLRREHQAIWGSISLLLLVALAVNLPVLHGHLALSRTQYRDFSPVRLVTQSISIQQASVSQRQRYVPIPGAILGDLRHVASPVSFAASQRLSISSVESLLHGLIDLPPPHPALPSASPTHS